MPVVGAPKAASKAASVLEPVELVWMVLLLALSLVEAVMKEVRMLREKTAGSVGSAAGVMLCGMMNSASVVVVAAPANL